VDDSRIRRVWRRRRDWSRAAPAEPTLPVTYMSPRPRILIVDDNPAIHEDFRKILDNPVTESSSQQDALETALFGAADTPAERVTFRLDFASQGQEALEKVRAALAENDPYALAFVDVRMPPGWDGIETLERIQPCTPDLQAVICTAYSDYSWDNITRRLGLNDRLLILKKPFETIEVLQLAHALTHKFALSQQARLRLEDLDRIVSERTQQLIIANEKLREEIAEHARAQEALRHSEERFSKAFTASPIPMAILSQPDGRIIDANASFLELTGATSEALRHNAPADLNLWSPHTVRKLARIQSGQHLRNHPCPFRRSDGSSRETVLWAEPISLDRGPCLLVIAEDVTDQLRLEGQLRQAQKMEAVGRLAAGIAHEFNNVLTVIQGHAELIRAVPTDARMVGESGGRISQASQRAATLTRELLAFSRKQPVQLKSVSLSEVVRASEKLLSQLLGERYELQIEGAAASLSLRADPGCLEQVLINLVVNARDAMPNGGTIRVATSEFVVSPAQAARNPDARPGPTVSLSVTDAGCGMSPDTLARIFDPFFTTKEVGKGTGLGLSIIHGIVRQHRGWIEVTSQPGCGSCFSICFPAVAPGEAPPAVRDSLPGFLPHCGKGEVILVVEDEPNVRELARATLERGGFAVLEAADAPAALDIWERAGQSIALVVTDMVLPHGPGGGKLVQLLQQRDPALRAIYITGYGSETVREELPATLRPGVNFLSKPFEPNVLLKAVSVSLEGRCVEGDVDSDSKALGLQPKG
jgi:two-component system cell cycle sensor histidine kinase/response regulator CckA